jgi:uncharacterized protein (UPF0261 family)
VQGVIDVTTTEVADYVVGGIMACGPNRFQSILQHRIPLVLSVGALDMVNFGNRGTVPEQFDNRQLHIHNDQVRLKPLIQTCLCHIFKAQLLSCMSAQYVS